MNIKLVIYFELFDHCQLVLMLFDLVVGNIQKTADPLISITACSEEDEETKSKLREWILHGEY